MSEGISIGLMRVPPIIKKFLASVTTSDVESAIAPKEAAYTPTFTGFGTATSVNFTWTRVGNRLKVMGKFTTGTVTATEARISLPGSLVSDAALVPSIEVCGIAIQLNAATTFFGLYCLIESGVGYITIGAQTSVNSAQTKALGNAISPSNQPFMVMFELPVSGWNV